jgi:hypothetical protein
MHRRKTGLTLIEVLVILFIVGIVIALLVCALQEGRESSRRISCLSNHCQIGIAMMSYEESQGYFPGYVNEIKGMLNNQKKQRKVSWYIVLLPHLDRMDLYQKWQDVSIPNTDPDNPLPGDSSAQNNPIPGIFDSLVSCPSNPPLDHPTAAWLAYRANTGRKLPNTFSPDPPDQRIPAQGVCTDQFPDPGDKQENIMRVGTKYISSKDGNCVTLLLGEKSSSKNPPSHWSPVDTPPKGQWSETNGINADALGFNWLGFDALNPPSSTAKVWDKINSNHPGGAVVTFCDSHSLFLRDDIDPVVFMQLMAPDDRGVLDDNIGIRNPTDTSKAAPLLDESKF